MDTQSKKVLVINLTRSEYEIKAFTDINKYIGGISLGKKLYQMFQENDPLIFSVGPLNGFFPFVSKTSVVFKDEGVFKDMYFGGSLSFRLRFSGLDSIVIIGQAKNYTVLDILDGETTFRQKDTDLGTLGLPGKRSVLAFDEKKFLLDEHFATADDSLEKKLNEKRVFGMVVTGTKIFTVDDVERYQDLYAHILGLTKDLSVTSGQNPSCSGCPMGCNKAKVGEIKLDGNVLVHSLVACVYAEKIYSNIGIVFSCLNVLGYDYTHEDLENLPKLFQEISIV